MGIILGLHGAQNTGKDEVAKVLVEQHGFLRIGFADALRQMACDLNPLVDRYDTVSGQQTSVYFADAMERHGYDRAKELYPEFRRTLQRLGTEVIRKWVGPGFWVQRVAEFVEAQQSDRGVVIPDLRFPNEFEWLSTEGGSCWWIHRDGFDFKPGHVSEEWHPDLDAPNLVHLDNSGPLSVLPDTVTAALKMTLDG